MTERTALFVASLSHAWFPVVMALPLVFGAAAYSAGKLQTRAYTGADTITQRFSTVLRAASYVLLAASVGVFGIAFIHLGCASLVSHRALCISNVRLLSAGMLMYAQDYDERLPAAPKWSEAINSRVTERLEEAVESDKQARRDPFLCPAATSPATYGFNAALNSVPLSEIDAPASTVLIFDADAPTRSFAGGLADVARTRHSDAPVIATADGHASQKNFSSLSQYDWTPKATNKP